MVLPSGMSRGSAATVPGLVWAPESVMPWTQYAVADTRIHCAPFALCAGLAAAETTTEAARAHAIVTSPTRDMRSRIAGALPHRWRRIELPRHAAEAHGRSRSS